MADVINAQATMALTAIPAMAILGPTFLKEPLDASCAITHPSLIVFSVTLQTRVSVLTALTGTIHNQEAHNVNNAMPAQGVRDATRVLQANV